MNVLVVTLELVLASKADLVVFAPKIWAFEVLGFDAMLGRGVAFEAGPAFGDELAAGLTTSIFSRLAVMEAVCKSLMLNKALQGTEVVPHIIHRCPVTIRDTAAKRP